MSKCKAIDKSMYVCQINDDEYIVISMYSLKQKTFLKQIQNPVQEAFYRNKFKANKK